MKRKYITSIISALTVITLVVSLSTSALAVFIPPLVPILSSNANLSDLGLSTSGIIPGFDAATTSYIGSTGGTSTQVLFKTAESHATVTVNGTPVLSENWSPAITTNPGTTIINIVVTAQNGAQKTYIVNVIRDSVSNNADLTDLLLDNVMTSPGFAPGTTTYMGNTNYLGTHVKFVTAQNDATVTVNGMPVLSGVYSPPILFNLGANEIKVEVTAQDGVTKKTYILNINRVSNANLLSLSLSTGGISPGFSQDTTTYTSPTSAMSTQVMVNTADPNSTVTVNGASVPNGNWSPMINTNPGMTVVTIVVTAPDGVTKRTYTVNVTRPGGSSDADLTLLALSTGSLSPAFTKANTAYISDCTTEFTQVAAFPNDSHATLKINGTDVISGIPFKVLTGQGTTTISVVVTAQDGTTKKTYTVNVTRLEKPAAPSSFIASLQPDGKLNFNWLDNSGNEDGFVIEVLSKNSVYEKFYTIDTPNHSAVSNIPNTIDLSGGEICHFRIYAYNAIGNSGPSNVSSLVMPQEEGPVDFSSASDWAVPEIQEAIDNNLTTETVLSNFKQNITREEFCSLAVKLYEALSGKKALPIIVNPFKDTDFVDTLKAVQLGIVNGVSPDTFAPYNNITRQEICVMLYRAIKAAKPNLDFTVTGVGPFADEDVIASWALVQIRFCSMHSIMKGTGNNTINPLGNTTREQAIVLVKRTLESFK